MEDFLQSPDFLIIGLSIAAAVVLLLFLLRKSRRRHYRTVKVHNVLDGDTVIVNTGWRKQIIRLSAIDCPENGQHWGDTAKFGLIKLIGGRNIRIEDHTVDKYGRIVATLYVQSGAASDWINVNARMVMLGHAWVYRQFYKHLPIDRRNELNRLERWARSKRVGLWKTENPIPPWIWRTQYPERGNIVYLRRQTTFPRSINR